MNSYRSAKLSFTEDCYRLLSVIVMTDKLEKKLKRRIFKRSDCSFNSCQAYEWVLHKAQQLEWSENSAKALVMIGDAIPQAPSYTDQHTNWHTELDILKGMGVKV